MADKNQYPNPFQNILFPNIFRSFRLAIHPTKLMIAFVAIAVICLSGWVMDAINPSVAAVVENDTVTSTELQIYIESPAEAEVFIEDSKDSHQRTGVFECLWRFTASHFHFALASLFAFDLAGFTVNVAECFGALRWAVKYHLLYSIVFFAIMLAALSIAGGCLCRIAALQLAQGEKPALSKAISYSVKRFLSFFTAPLTPLVIIVFIGLFVFILGLIANIPYVGELIMGVSMPLALIGGTIITVILVGVVAGFILMFPAIAYDGSDAFDSISRAFSYIYARPWKMGFYVAVATVYGSICYWVVRLFGFLLIWVPHRLVDYGVFAANPEGGDKLHAMWPEPEFMNFLGSAQSAPSAWTQTVASFLVFISVLAVIGLLAAFIASFCFSASTVIYALLRKQVDNTPIEDIYIPRTEEFQPSPEKDTEEMPAETQAEEAAEQADDESPPEKDSQQADQNRSDHSES